MRNFNLIAALAATTAIATLAFAQTANKRTYVVRDNTTADTRMSDGNPPVRCDANLMGVGIKCSSATEWRTIPRGGAMTVTCSAADDHMQYADLFDTEDARRVSWESCASNAQSVSITGRLSTCWPERLSASSQCQVSSS